MTNSGDGKSLCCISHSFLAAASKNPSKIAIIHASGGATVLRQWRARGDRGPVTEDEFRVSSSPPLYQGDEYYKFSEVSAAVEFLGLRIRRVLDGGDDRDLFRPKGLFGRSLTAGREVSEPSQVVSRSTPSQSINPCFLPDSRNQNEHISIERHRMLRSGCCPEIIGVYILPSVDYIVAVLSILRSGAAFLPLDPSWPKERVSSIIAFSKIELIITDSSLFDRNETYQLGRSNWLMETDKLSVLCISTSRIMGEMHDQSEFIWPCERRNQRNFCYVMYTSGSTGEPKGVCGTEEGLLNRFFWMQTLFPFNELEISVFKTSVSFIDHLQEFLSAILSGTTVVVPPPNELKKDPFSLIDFLEAYGVSRLTTVPSLMRTMLPALDSSQGMKIQKFLHVLVLSGETFHASLCHRLQLLLPRTSILNLYGSTEVSGDCMYFDCKYLCRIMEFHTLSSVPIGNPILNCEILLVGEADQHDEGEIYVGGTCLSAGYLQDFFAASSQSSDYVVLNKDIIDHGSGIYYKTGDLACKLQTGDYNFMGRKDRIVKINGQRVSLEEIENVLREHPDVVDAAVVAWHKSSREIAYIGAFLVTNKKKSFCKGSCSHDGGKFACKGLSLMIRSWLAQKLPQAMIPSLCFSMELLPLSSSGKINYSQLEKLGSNCFRDEIDDNNYNNDFLQKIKEAYHDALMVKEVRDDDDFFLMGGNSITAAHVAHKLGIDMRLLYKFRSPSKLFHAVLDGQDLHEIEPDPMIGDKNSNERTMLVPFEKPMLTFMEEADIQQLNTRHKNNNHSTLYAVPPEKESGIYIKSKVMKLHNASAWFSRLYFPTATSFNRCNKLVCESEQEIQGTSFSVELRKNKAGDMQDVWTVHLESCVDASPLVVYKGGKFYLFIGSHSHMFVCVDALSGSVRWEVKLEGRIESSAAVTGDFSQVVVGCYDGKIYFLDFLTGKISWVFQVGAEVKSQPVMDKRRSLIWCGSHDRHIYALDYRNRICVGSIFCGGSIYGSPAIDEVDNKLYVASTSGRVTAVSTEELPFSVVWRHEAGAPIFGSLFMSANRHVICCLVDGHVLALNSSGSVIWKLIVGGPIFAGACISRALPSQVLICSRNGSVYSFQMDTGDLLWDYCIGDPITSSAYIDENVELVSDPCRTPDRLVCICSSSGAMYVLRVDPNCTEPGNQMVRKFATLELPGDIFSSPVMIGGQIFVGCRDDHVHSIKVVC